MSDLIGILGFLSVAIPAAAVAVIMLVRPDRYRKFICDVACCEIVKLEYRNWSNQTIRIFGCGVAIFALFCFALLYPIKRDVKGRGRS